MKTVTSLVLLLTFAYGSGAPLPEKEEIMCRDKNCRLILGVLFFAFVHKIIFISAEYSCSTNEVAAESIIHIKNDEFPSAGNKPISRTIDIPVVDDTVCQMRYVLKCSRI